MQPVPMTHHDGIPLQPFCVDGPRCHAVHAHPLGAMLQGEAARHLEVGVGEGVGEERRASVG